MAEGKALEEGQSVERSGQADAKGPEHEGSKQGPGTEKAGRAEAIRAWAKKRDWRRPNAKTVRLAVAGLLVLAAVVVGIVALAGGFDSGEGGSGGESEAVSLSASELLAQAGSLSGPAYWIGPRTGTSSYELTDTPDGRIYIRYLTEGAEAGDPQPNFLTIGTYPIENAKEAIEAAAEEGDGRALSRHNGYEALSSEGAASAYVVFDDEPNAQIEVFSPQRGEAARLATSGAVEPLR